MGNSILAIISFLVGTFLHKGANVSSADMGDSIRKALSAEHSWAKVDVDGNVAKLSGEAPNQGMADKAMALANKAVAGSTGKSDGTCKSKCKAKAKFSVANKTTLAAAVVAPKPKLAETISPYRFKAEKLEDGKVNLTGYVPTEDDRSRVYTRAEELFAERLNRKDVKIAAGAPDANWDDVISAHLPQLQPLDRGTFTLTDRKAVVRGVASKATIKDSANNFSGNVSNMYAGYDGTANITVPEVTDRNVCQGLFDEVKKGKRVNFASGKAEIRGSESFNLLNSVASTANQCQSFKMRIEGHTDSEGNADYNQWLSEQRANTVRAYLADNGVDVGRLTAVGLGETQPIASNDTPAGMAANRRIEFVVTQSN